MSTAKTMDHADTCGATYAPGPWADHNEASYASGVSYRNVGAYGPDGLGLRRTVAMVPGFDHPESIATARLIAAAPELVEALKHLLDALEGPSRTSLEDIEIAICAGRAALSKALGTPVSGRGGER